MLTLHSCSSCLRFISLQIPNRFNSLSTLIFSKPSFLSLKSTIMSSSRPPSAFDALMANARAAAKKNSKSISPKKRKSPDSRSIAQTLNSNLAPQNPPIPDSNPPAQDNTDEPKVEREVVNNPNARAAAKKNSKSISPKKRNSPDSRDIAQTLNSNLPPQNPPIPDSNPPAQDNTDEPKVEQEVVNNPQNPSSENPSLPLVQSGQENVTNIAKKQRLEIAELKSKIEFLKKSPMEFDPKKVLFWEKDQKVPFLFACLAFELIQKESGRILKTNMACNMLRTVMDTTPDDLLALVYLMANRIAPPHEGVEMGVGEATLIKALSQAFGRTEIQVKAQLKGRGDLGIVAQESRSSQSMMRKPEALTIAKVFNTFRQIAKESGKDSQDKKRNHIKGLLVATTDCEPLYLIRLLQGRLRINLAGQTLLTALGQAAVCTEKHCTPPEDIRSPLEEATKIVKQVYSILPIYDKIVPALLSDGVWNLSKMFTFTLGIPVGPMLANSVTSISQILNKFENTEFTCEYKYDGERAQIHYLENGSVEIYSRNAERNTEKYPDVVDAISRLKRPAVKSFVLDCEIVAYSQEERKILSFQTLAKRARKNVIRSDIKISVCIFAFDMLYLNGEPLIQQQLEVRRQRLYESFKEDPGYFQFATAVTSNDLEEIQKFLDAAISASCEGLIIKTLNRDATYEPSKRSNNWLKLKKDYMESFGDSLDLVPIAAFHGRGKRTGVYGAFLLACYDSSNEEFQSICKIGTGFSEQMLETLSDSLRSKVIPKPKSYYRYGDKINPDVWFEPSEVWEVKAADLTISPAHSAAIGLVEEDKGVSLRFPRLVRVREDKTPEDATSSEQVAQLYQNQQNQSNEQEDVDDD